MKSTLAKWAVVVAVLGTPTAYAFDTTIIAIKRVDSIVELDGTVEAVNRGTLSAQTSGRIVTVNADVNDIVNQGDVLLEISAEQQSASLDAALAQLNSANAQNIKALAQIKRYRELFPKGAISRERLDAAEAKRAPLLQRLNEQRPLSHRRKSRWATPAFVLLIRELLLSVMSNWAKRSLQAVN